MLDVTPLMFGQPALQDAFFNWYGVRGKRPGKRGGGMQAS